MCVGGLHRDPAPSFIQQLQLQVTADLRARPPWDKKRWSRCFIMALGAWTPQSWWRMLFLMLIFFLKRLCRPCNPPPQILVWVAAVCVFWRSPLCPNKDFLLPLCEGEELQSVHGGMWGTRHQQGTRADVMSSESCSSTARPKKQKKTARR